MDRREGLSRWWVRLPGTCCHLGVAALLLVPLMVACAAAGTTIVYGLTALTHHVPLPY